VEEPSDVTERRYTMFAEDVATAVSQPYVRALIGPLDAREAHVRNETEARALTGLVMLSTARHETSFIGWSMDCAAPEKGEVWDGDHGHSWGPFQTQRARKRVCWSYLGAAGVALEMMHESFHVTRGRPLDERLMEYTDGGRWMVERDSAIRERLTKKAAGRSRSRMGLALRYWASHPFAE